MDGWDRQGGLPPLSPSLSLLSLPPSLRVRPSLPPSIAPSLPPSPPSLPILSLSPARARAPAHSLLTAPPLGRIRERRPTRSNLRRADPPALPKPGRLRNRLTVTNRADDSSQQPGQSRRRPLPWGAYRAFARRSFIEDDSSGAASRATPPGRHRRAKASPLVGQGPKWQPMASGSMSLRTWQDWAQSPQWAGVISWQEPFQANWQSDQVAGRHTGQ